MVQKNNKSINDKNLIKLIENNILPIQPNMLENSISAIPDEIKEEEFSKITKVLQEKISILQERNVVFTLKTLSNAVYSDQSIKQELRTNYILEQILLNYKNFNNDGDEIICLGHPALEIFTTKSQIEKELKLIQLVSKLNPNINFEMDEEIIKNTIAENPMMSKQQINAVYACSKYNRHISMVEGYAGAGKSFTMGAVSKIYKYSGYHLRGITLSWKAAEVLKYETNMPCISMSAFISEKNNQIARKEDPFAGKEMIIVDEAGLIGLNQMTSFLEIVESSKHPVKVILSGDTLQLEPIGEPNALELIQRIMDVNSHAVISEIRRQNSLSHRNAVLLLKDGYSGEALYLYHQQEAIKFCNDNEHIKNKVLQDYLSALKQTIEKDTKETMLIICYDNKMVNDLNDRIREIMINVGQVNKETEVTIPIARKQGATTLSLEKKFAVGDNIVFTKIAKNIFLHDKYTHEQLNVFLSNRLTGKISKIEGNIKDGYNLTVDIPIDNKTKKMAYVKINTKSYGFNNRCAIDYNYAITAYSSQGQTVSRVFLIDSKLIDRRHAYVLCSRHREALHIYINKKEVMQDMVKNKIYKDENDFNINGSTISMLNHIGARWGRKSQQQSAVIKFLDMLEEIREINARYKNANIDLNNLDENYLKLRNFYRKEKKEKEREKTLFQKPRQNFPILDTPEYYKTPADKVNLEELREIKGVYNEDIVSYDLVPLKEIENYSLTPILNEELFTQLKGELFDIGKGGVLNMISKIGDTVISKYNIFGKDVLQTGLPFLVTAGYKSNSNDILICQDLNQFIFYLNELYVKNDNHKNNPTIIWGTKDTDYKFVYKSLDKSNIYLIGDDKFKEEHFIKITQALKGHYLNAQFNNFHSDWLSEEGWEKIERNSLDHIQYNSNINSDFFPIVSYLNIDNNLNEKNTIVDEEGKISNELLAKFIQEENIITDKILNEQIIPNRVINRINSINKINIKNNKTIGLY